MASTINASLSSGIVQTADTSGVLQLQTASTTAVTIDTAQNMGLGVVPSAWGSSSKAIQLNGGNSLFSNTSGLGGVGNNVYSNPGTADYYIANGYATRYYQYNGTHVWNIAPSGTAGGTITFTQAMTLDNSGNLLLNTTSSLAQFTVLSASSSAKGIALVGRSSDNASTIDFWNNAGSTRYAYVYADAGGPQIGSVGALPLIFNTNGAERARIDTSGNLLVGTTSTSETAGVGAKIITSSNTSFKIVTNGSTNTSGSYFSYSATAGAYRFYVDDAGTIHATSTTITATSDERLKENIRTLDFGLNEIMSIQPRRFDWKEGKGLNKKDDVGFIAQEFEKVFPNSVTTSLAGEDGIAYKAINQSELIPTLVKAIQELNALVTAQAAEITALKAKVG